MRWRHSELWGLCAHEGHVWQWVLNQSWEYIYIYIYIYIFFSTPGKSAPREIPRIPARRIPKRIPRIQAQNGPKTLHKTILGPTKPLSPQSLRVRTSKKGPLMLKVGHRSVLQPKVRIFGILGALIVGRPQCKPPCCPKGCEACRGPLGPGPVRRGYKGGGSFKRRSSLGLTIRSG